MEQIIEIQKRKDFWLSFNGNNNDTLNLKCFLKFKSNYMLYYSNQNMQVIFWSTANLFTLSLSDQFRKYNNEALQTLAIKTFQFLNASVGFSLPFSHGKRLVFTLFSLTEGKSYRYNLILLKILTTPIL